MPQGRSCGSAKRKEKFMAEPNMIYKISVLLLLSKVDIPLSNAQIVQFFLDKEYTDYFTIQQVISDLEEAIL